MKKLIFNTALFCIFFSVKICAQSPLNDKFLVIDDGYGNSVLFLNNSLTCVTGVANAQSFNGTRNDSELKSLKDATQAKDETIMVLVKDSKRYIFKHRQNLWHLVTEPFSINCSLEFEPRSVTTIAHIVCESKYGENKDVSI